MTDLATKDLTQKGMPIRKLINCLKEKQEDIYTATALCYPDIGLIITALEEKAMRESCVSEGRGINMHRIETLREMHKNVINNRQADALNWAISRLDSV